jgi:hypothetical protein
MKEEILDMIILGGYTDGAPETAEFIAKMVTNFIEWACTTHVKLHQVWCGLYQNQTDQSNWKTTEQLFTFWNEHIRYHK